MNAGVRPVILESAHIQRAISDPNFFTRMPEFLPVKKKMEALHVDMGKGCSTCRRRRLANTVNSDFVSVLNSLTPDGYARLKKYIGAEKLLVRAMDRTLNRPVLREV